MNETSGNDKEKHLEREKFSHTMKSFHLLNCFHSPIYPETKKIFNLQAISYLLHLVMTANLVSLNTIEAILSQLINSPQLSLESKTMEKLFGKHKMKQKSHSGVTISNPCEFGNQRG